MACLLGRLGSDHITFSQHPGVPNVEPTPLDPPENMLPREVNAARRRYNRPQNIDNQTTGISKCELTQVLLWIGTLRLVIHVVLVVLLNILLPHSVFINICT